MWDKDLSHKLPGARKLYLTRPFKTVHVTISRAILLRNCIYAAVIMSADLETGHKDIFFNIKNNLTFLISMPWITFLIS